MGINIGGETEEEEQGTYVGFALHGERRAVELPDVIWEAVYIGWDKPGWNSGDNAEEAEGKNDNAGSKLHDGL